MGQKLIVAEPTLSRAIGDMPRANGRAHAMVAYGYFDLDDGRKMVRYRDSWGSGDGASSDWGPGLWAANMPLRGVITQTSPQPDPPSTESHCCRRTNRVARIVYERLP